MSVTFNNRLQADHYQLVKSGTTTIMSANYGYYSDGALKKVDDLADDKFDRMNTFDNVGRIKTAKTSLEARGGTATGTQLDALPYRQSYSFNAFGNLLERNNLHWGGNEYLAHSFTNNRITDHPIYSYDADGRQTGDYDGSHDVHSTYDAAGQLTLYHRARGNDEYEVLRYYDGNGREGKRRERDYLEAEPEEWEWQEHDPKYYIRSTVLGGEVVSDVNSGGGKIRTYVRAAGAVLAWDGGDLSFQAWDAAGMSYRTTGVYGDLFTQAGYEGAPAEMDLAGGNVGKVTHRIQYDPGNYCVGCGVSSPLMSMFVNGRSVPCSLDGMRINCSQLNGLQEHLGYEDPDKNVSPLETLLPGVFYIPRTFSRINDKWAPTSWWVISSQTGQEIPERRLTTEEVGAIKANVKRNLNQKCRDFIKDMIERMQELTGGEIVSTNVEDILNQVDGVFGYLSSPSNGHAVKNSIYLPITNNIRRHLGIDANGRGITRGISMFELNAMSNHDQEMTRFLSFVEFSTSSAGAATTVHELIHLAIRGGVVSDETMEAGAALSIGGQTFEPPKGATQEEILSAASSIFHDRLAGACGWQRRDLTRVQNYIKSLVSQRLFRGFPEGIEI